jgi:hypothetical protein
MKGAGAGVALCLAILFDALTSNAAPPTVVLLRPEPADPALSEALIRMEGELRADGFEVKIVPRALDRSPLESIDVAGRALAPAAIIGIFGDRKVGLEFWIADRLTGKKVVRRLDAESVDGAAPETLAIRAAELLRASMVELDITPNTPTSRPNASQPAPPVAPALSGAQAVGPVPSRVALEVGVGTALGLDGIGPSFVPIVRLQWAALSTLRVRVGGFGFGRPAGISAPQGSAAISQDTATVDGVFLPRPLATLSPRLSFGVGASHFGVEGRGIAPNEGTNVSRWLAAVDAGLGVAYRRNTFIEVALEAHAIFLEPYPIVQIGNQTNATAGRPTILLSATLAGWL